MRSRLLIPAVAVVGILTASCSIAELPPVTTGTTTTGPPPTAAEAADEFQSCLNAHGLDVSDLLLDESGRPDLSLLSDTVDEGAVVWRGALTACAGVIVSSGALDLSGHPELAAAVRTRLEAFATCMRSQGVEGFPDPAVDFDGTTPPYPRIPLADSDLRLAAEACAQTLGEAGPP